MTEAASPWITQLEIVDRQYRNGDRQIAEFSATFAGMTVRGLELVRTEAGGFRATSPAISRKDSREAIRFNDDALRHAIMDAALRVYRQMGGQHGLYAGQEGGEDR